MKMRKIVALAAVASMLVGSLAGCTGAAEETGNGGAAVGDDAIANLIAATEGTVSLTVWASEEDQAYTQTLIDEFIAAYPDVTFDIQLGSESESTCKDTVLTDIEAAADVFAFADDQIQALVDAGALQPINAYYTYDVANENVAGAVDAASVDGQLYAYPMTADNGYFMFYDSSIYTEEDVQSLDAMIAAAEASGTKIGMDLSSGWYLYSFFAGAGLETGLNEDGVTNFCEWNADGGADVAQAIIDYFGTGVLVNMTDDEQATAIANGEISACVNGTWRAETAAEAWGDNYAACKLPTFTLNGNQTQMSSFSGCKLIGVNAYSDQIGWSMLLAEFLTNEDAQIGRFNERGLGPSNIAAASSPEVQANPAIAALAAQADYATPQRIGGNYWAPSQTLGEILASGNPDGTDIQALLDTAVEGIEAPVA
ncbi:MAG: extracellular solute-binding protein [Clostridiales bacterium]|nr:extracellular solute-binding protein [Clostridiales bacterium]